jgi:hypothetical protein
MDQHCKPRATQISTTGGADNDSTPRLMVMLKRVPNVVIDPSGISHEVGSIRQIDAISLLPTLPRGTTATCGFTIKLSDIPSGLNLLAQGRERFPIQ